MKCGAAPGFITFVSVMPLNIEFAFRYHFNVKWRAVNQHHLFVIPHQNPLPQSAHS